MNTSTSETTRVRTGFAMPHPLTVIDESRRNGREVVAYRAFGLSEDGTRWEQKHKPISVYRGWFLDFMESNGYLLSPVYADEVK